MGAPIAFFAFKRPEHTRRALAALALNPEFQFSELHVFCDGPRRDDERSEVEATREIVRAWPHPRKTLYEASRNRGLAASIIDGVATLCNVHGRVIVIEDDLVVAPVFLEYLNRALVQYECDQRVMQISAHMFDVDVSAGEGDAFFLPFTTSWGWATWARAWSHYDPDMKGFNRLFSDGTARRRFDLDNAFPYYAMLKKQRGKAIDSWAIRWYLSVFERNGVALFPRKSLVINNGFDGSGTHRARHGNRDGIRLPEVCPIHLPREIEVDLLAEKQVAGHLRASRRGLRCVYDWYQRWTSA